MRTLSARTVIADRYELGRGLATGGMAVIWQAWDRRLCRPVAVKTLRDEDLDDATAFTRLRREALVSAALTSANIIEIYDLVEDEGRPALVLELVEGEDLKRRIRRQGALDPIEALTIGQQVCRALIVSHARNVIHRDVKPHNILLGRDGHAKLTDYGLALSPLDADPDDPSVVFGTPEYMAPEQAMGETITPATDLYALGVTLYEVLTGEVPFQGPSAEETMRNHAEAPITPLRRVRPELAPCVERVVMRALAKDPDRRYASAQAMYEALGQAIEEARQPSSLALLPAAPRRATHSRPRRMARPAEQPRAAQPAFPPEAALEPALPQPVAAFSVAADADGALIYQPEEDLGSLGAMLFGAFATLNAAVDEGLARLDGAPWGRILCVALVVNVLLVALALCLFGLHAPL